MAHRGFNVAAARGVDDSDDDYVAPVRRVSSSASSSDSGSDSDAYVEPESEDDGLAAGAAAALPARTASAAAAVPASRAPFLTVNDLPRHTLAPRSALTTAIGSHRLSVLAVGAAALRHMEANDADSDGGRYLTPHNVARATHLPAARCQQLLGCLHPSLHAQAGVFRFCFSCDA